MAPNQPDWKMGSQKGLLEDVTTQGSPEGIKKSHTISGVGRFPGKVNRICKDTKDGARMNMGFFCNTRRKWSASKGVVLGKTREGDEGWITEALGCLSV